MNDHSFPCDVLETTDAIDLCGRVDVRLDPARLSNKHIRAVTHRVLLLETATDPVLEPGYRDLPAARRILVGTLDALRDLYDPSDSAADVQWFDGAPPASLDTRVRATFAAAGLEPRPILRWAEDSVAEIRARPRRTRRSIFIRERPARFLGRWVEPAWGRPGAHVALALHAPFLVVSVASLFVTPSLELVAASMALLLALCVNLLLHGVGNVFGESRSPRGRRFAAAAARAPQSPDERTSVLAAD
jgi:hypothetical protein